MSDESPAETIPQEQPPSAPDRLTLAALGALSYALFWSLHLAGRYAASAALGHPVGALTALRMQIPHAVLAPPHHLRLVMAGGLATNLFLLILGLALCRLLPRTASWGRFFGLLLAVVNGSGAVGYLLFLPRTGDWVVLREAFAHPQAAQMTGLVVLLALYLGVLPCLFVPLLEEWLGGDPQRSRRAGRLLRIPYLVGSLTLVAAAAVGPDPGSDIPLAVTLGFYATFLLAILPSHLGPPAPASRPPSALPWNPALVVLAVAGMMAYVLVLGPGLRW